MPERLNQLRAWVSQTLALPAPEILAVTNDASFRRYFRVSLAEGSLIVMDAPPERENCLPFIHIAQKLADSGLNVPKVIEADLAQGFLLLTDLGSDLYLPALQNGQAESLYQDALRALVVMQACTSTEGVPLYDHALLHTEMNLFRDWLVGTHLNLELTTKEASALAASFELLSQSALSQPQVFVHRDYHSRNLMITPHNNPGILDFQDAVCGAVTYDLVSLLRDCYIKWTPEQVAQWVRSYYLLALQSGILKGVEEQQFTRWFDLMGIQRHLKVSGIFARLYRRDGKSGYLQDIPLALGYIVQVSSAYPELRDLYDLVKHKVLPAYQQSLQSPRA
jgi:aminoglycoside/choline kinase family phosphotransferase